MGAGQRFSHSTITGKSVHAFDHDDLVDGGQDKQLDTITFEQEVDSATVYILQMKNTESFSSNDLIRMKNGLDWLFGKPRADINTLTNTALRDKIIEYRSLQGTTGPANLDIIVGFITNGVTSEISDEFKQEMKTILDRYDNATFASFSLRIWGCDELIEELNRQEKKNRKLNADIQIRYDANNPSLVKYHAEGLKGLVCTTTAAEIARIVNSDSLGSVFDANIRRFLGTRGAVNSDIMRTCTDRSSSYLFWFLNNGLTVVCDDFDAVTDPDNPLVKVKNLQIVNGCQTASTLSLAAKAGTLSGDTRVLLRVYATNNRDLLDRIVLTTNNQNKISGRDLRSNDQVQLDMEKGFSRYSYWYERKPRQYDDQAGADISRIVPNELVAQAYLAVVLKMPSDARRRKYKVWGELYDRIFGGNIIEPYVLSVQLFHACDGYLQRAGFGISEDELTRRLAKSGVFHLSRITAYLWRRSEAWDNPAELAKSIAELSAKPTSLDTTIGIAFRELADLIANKPVYVNDFDGAIKSADLDADITRMLHIRRK